MISLILGLAEQALRLINEKERNKLHDELLELQIDLAKELEKDNPDHAKLDRLEQKIFLVGNSIVKRLKK